MSAGSLALWVRSGDVTLHSVREGRGQPVLCLHGGPGAGHAYLRRGLHELRDELSLLHFDQRTVQRPDYQPRTHSLAAHLEDMDRVLDAHAIEQCVLLGHSFGAVLALLYAARRPERVSGLVLVNLVSVCPLDRWDFSERVAERLESDAFATYLASQERALVRLTPTQRRARFAFIHAHWPLLTRTHLLDQLPFYCVSPDLREQLWDEVASAFAALSEPEKKQLALVVQGADDATPLATAVRVATKLADVRSLALPGCGHLAPLEAPELLCRAVRTFARELVGTPQRSVRVSASGHGQERTSEEAQSPRNHLGPAVDDHGLR